MEELIFEEKKKHKKPDRSIKTDSLLRETSTHYIRLIGDADRKARIMVVVASILLTAGITLLTEVINKIPYVWICACILIITTVFSLCFSILSVKPDIKSASIKETENNMLHYKKCTEYNFHDYAEMMTKTLDENEKKREAIMKELYYYGNLLDMKYKFIKLAYQFFFWGIIFSVVSYMVILFAKNA